MDLRYLTVHTAAGSSSSSRSSSRGHSSSVRGICSQRTVPTLQATWITLCLIWLGVTVFVLKSLQCRPVLSQQRWRLPGSRCNSVTALYSVPTRSLHDKKLPWCQSQHHRHKQLATSVASVSVVVDVVEGIPCEKSSFLWKICLCLQWFQSPLSTRPIFCPSDRLGHSRHGCSCKLVTVENALIRLGRHRQNQHRE